MLTFLPFIDNSFTIGLSFLLLSILAIMSSKTINIFYVIYLDCILQYFYKYHAYHLSIQ